MAVIQTIMAAPNRDTWSQRGEKHRECWEGEGRGGEEGT